jgi:hypothetical protein
LPYHPIIQPKDLKGLYEKLRESNLSQAEERLIWLVIQLGVMALNLSPDLCPVIEDIFTRGFAASLELFDEKSNSITLLQTLLIAAIVATLEARDNREILHQAHRVLQTLW